MKASMIGEAGSQGLFRLPGIRRDCPFFHTVLTQKCTRKSKCSQVHLLQAVKHIKTTKRQVWCSDSDEIGNSLKLHYQTSKNAHKPFLWEIKFYFPSSSLRLSSTLKRSEGMKEQESVHLQKNCLCIILLQEKRYTAQKLTRRTFDREVRGSNPIGQSGCSKKCYREWNPDQLYCM